MSVECCGSVRTTPFCPECGASLLPKSANLNGLLAHVRTHAKNLRKQHEIVTKRLQEDPCDSYYMRQVERSAKNASKWEAWAEALLKLMVKDDS